MPGTPDPSFWAEIAAYFAAALASISGWAWRHTNSLVKEKADGAAVVTLAAEVKEKADDRRVESVASRLEVAFANQREDNQRIFQQISKVADSHTAFTERVIEALGSRPTREEVREMWGRKRDRDDGL